MEEYQFVRCLFCATGSEKMVVDEIHRRKLGKALFPTRVRRVLRNRVWTEVDAALLPGYVFVYMDDMSIERSEFLSIKSVGKVLTYPSDVDTLHGADLSFANWLWRMNGKIDTLKAVQEGDTVQIIDGAFKALHGRITKMDRRRKTVRMELESSGHIRKLWLSYDLVQRPGVFSDANDDTCEPVLKI